MKLSEKQLAAAEKGASVRVTENGMEFVVVRADLFDRLRQALYDDSPWTEEEMDLLASENADLLGWDGMEGYQERE